MKKRLMLVLCAAISLLHAKEVETVTVVENESVTIKAPFEVKNYAPSNKEVVRIELLGGTSIRVTGLKRGRCDLDVTGENRLVQKYEISCVSDLASVLEVLIQDLDGIPEARADIRGNNIRIDGEIGSIQKWEELVKVINTYGGVVKNFAKFSPGPEIILHLKNTLEQAGFTVQFKPFKGEGDSWPYNTVALDLNKMTRVLSVQARCLNEGQVTSIKAILNAQDWLAFNPDNDWKKKVELPEDKAPYAIRTLCKIYVDPVVIRLSVAYMAIGESDIRQIGNPNAASGNGVLGLDGTFGIIRDLLHGGHTLSKTASVGASLDVTARFLRQNQISRISDVGYTLVENWNSKGAKFKSGGTRFVPSMSGGGNAQVVVGNSKLEPIEYGFTINAKGGLVDKQTMKVDFDFSLSSILYVEGEGTYDRKEDNSTQVVSMPIGKTTFIGGFSDLVDKNTPPSGLPFIRSTPILNWFVAESGKSVTDRKLVIMVCPEIVNNAKDQQPDVEKVINIPVQDQESKDTDDVLDKRKEEKGFWSWLGF